jgi:hypothetical protein
MKPGATVQHWTLWWGSRRQELENGIEEFRLRSNVSYLLAQADMNPRPLCWSAFSGKADVTIS